MADRNDSITCRVTVIWNRRAKKWDIVVGGGDGTRHWTWRLVADTTVAVDEGTAWIIGKAVVDALEAQLL